MVNSVTVDVDFNGIVVFDYPKIVEMFGGEIPEGKNILKEFTTTNIGDEALEKGVCLPILGIDDGGYTVRFFVDEEPENINRQVVFSDKYFYLNVIGTLYVADLSALWEWYEYLGWEKTEVPKGMYKVCLEGVRTLNEQGETKHCYDLIMQSVDEIGNRDLEPRSNSSLN